VATDVALARGLVDATGARHRRARLRPPTGQIEVDLAFRAGRITADDADELLATCLERIGDVRGVTEDVVGTLSAGDRARLALALRATLLGGPVLLVVQCPAVGCGALADLTLSTADLLGDTARPQPLAVGVPTPDGDLAVRPPTRHDERAAAGCDEHLWGRLVSRSGEPIGADGWLSLDPASSQAVAAALADLDPCADLAFVSTCPQCGTWIEVELDPVDLLVRSLATGERRLLAEVHCLAFHYGWSEAEILALSRPRRLAYLELLRDQVEGRPLTGAGA
jgi:hypothetical protein